MSYFTTYQINDHIYQIKDPMGVLVTLIVGSKKALLIDTAYGIGNLKEYILSITTKPLIVINSHGHMDHTGGNYQFPKVYIHKLDYKLCIEHNSLHWRVNNLQSADTLNLLTNDFNRESYLNEREGNLILLKESQIFFLGNLHLKVIPMEGHTKGSIGVLCEEDHILITTDATCPFVWLFLPESTTVETYIEMLQKTLTLPFTHFLVGHGAGVLLEKNRMFSFLETAQNINIDESIKVSFKNFENLNSYCYTKYKLYDQSGSGVVFDPNKLKKN